MPVGIEEIASMSGRRGREKVSERWRKRGRGERGVCVSVQKTETMGEVKRSCTCSVVILMRRLENLCVNRRDLINACSRMNPTFIWQHKTFNIINNRKYICTELHVSSTSDTLHTVKS